MYSSQNYIKIAVDRLGGPTKSAHAMKVSNTTIHDWIRKGKIIDIEKARLMSKLTGVELQQLRSTW